MSTPFLFLSYYTHFWVPKSAWTDEGHEGSQYKSSKSVWHLTNFCQHFNHQLFTFPASYLSAFSLAIFLELPSSCFYNSCPHPTQIGVRSNFTLKRVKNLFHILITFCILFKFFDCLDPFKLSCKLSSCFTDLITTLIQAFELSLCLWNRHSLLCLYGCS